MQTLRYEGWFKPALLYDELIAAGIVPVRLEGKPDATEVSISVGDEVDPKAVMDVVWAHNPDVLTQDERQALLAETAADSLRSHLEALIGLPPRDAAYAVVARSYAEAANEPPEVIAEIVDRSSATAYLAGTEWWAALTSVQRQYKMLDLEAEAIRLQGMIAVLR